jgi:aspartate/glutamate racemase
METRLIGMIGGLGPAATAHYYLAMNGAFAGRGATPRLIVNHADMALVLDAATRGDYRCACRINPAFPRRF